MPLYLPFIRDHQRVLSRVRFEGRLPHDYSNNWTYFLMLAVSGKEGSHYEPFYLLTRTEVHELVPGLAHKVFSSFLDQEEPHLPKSVRCRSYAVPSSSTHPLSEVLLRVRMFATVAGGKVHQQHQETKSFSYQA